MIRSDKYEYLFVSTPKTGTHTMYATLTNDWEGHQVGPGYHPSRREYGKAPASYVTFSTCRHPFERLVAAWNSLAFHPKYRTGTMRLCGGDTFQQFAEFVLLLPKRGRICHFGGSDTISSQTARLNFTPDYWLKIEDIEGEFQRLPFVDRPQTFPRLLHRPHAHWQDVITDPELRNRLYEHYKHDFEGLGYADPRR